MSILLGWIFAGVDWDSEQHRAQPGEFGRADDEFWYFVYAGVVLGWILFYGLRRVLPRPPISTPEQQRAEFVAGRVVLFFAVAGAVLGCALPPRWWLSLVVDLGDASVDTTWFPTIHLMIWVLGCAGWCAAVGQLVACAIRWRHADGFPSVNTARMTHPPQSEPKATVPIDAVQARPDDGLISR